MTEFISPNPHLHDLYLIQFGMEACKPGHSFGPSIREYYKIHYILDGEGVFQYEGKRYNLKKVTDSFSVLKKSLFIKQIMNVRGIIAGLDLMELLLKICFLKQDFQTMCLFFI